MAGFAITCAWMFLQLNVILLWQSVPNAANPLQSRTWNEFQKDVEQLKLVVVNCPKNCSVAQMTVDRKCQCLNLNMSVEDCTPPDFFINGVMSLNVSRVDTVKLKAVGRITRKLLQLKNSQPDGISSLQKDMSCKLGSIISPKFFLEKLKNLGEELHSATV